MNIPAEIIEVVETELHKAVTGLQEGSNRHDGKHILNGDYIAIYAPNFDEAMILLLNALKKIRAYKP